MAIVGREEKDLYLRDIFDPRSTNPSSLHIAIPYVNDQGVTSSVPRVLTGLLASEPTVSTSNKWGPILNDMSMLSFFSSLAGFKSIPTWIGASAQCWKGTDPIRINLDFYLINYKRGLGLEEGLRDLTKLTSLTVDLNSFTSVFIHGGYRVDPFTSNAGRFNNSVADYQKNGKPMSETEISDYNEETRNLWGSMINSYNSQIKAGTEGVGTVSIDIGNKLRLDKLLVAAVNVTPSIVEVPDRKPLYYHVTTSLIGCRPLMAQDVDEMYK